jgi:hypothetical protein
MPRFGFPGLPNLIGGLGSDFIAARNEERRMVAPISSASASTAAVSASLSQDHGEAKRGPAVPRSTEHGGLQIMVR